MKVFKFGGASVKDAEGVKNLVSVVKQSGEQNLVVVVSAMGKMTNQLEKVVDGYLLKNNELTGSLQDFEEFHLTIMKLLFDANHEVYKKTSNLLSVLKEFLQSNKSTNRAYVYDQIVGFGELMSTTIISTYLNENGIINTWLDARKCIVTDANFRDANVDWDTTQKAINEQVTVKGITVTQGFLGAEATNNFTVTLGREGSDYTAAIFAYCLNASNVTIWKDVPGVLNADPRYFQNTTLLHHISYREAIELAFYGASVIHPKTLQPLQRKEIPLFVKSFYDPTSEGTCVGKGVQIDPQVSCFILKRKQVLLSLSSLDFSFMMENHIGDVFKWLHHYKMKVEMIQNSAISFSVVVDNKYDNLGPLITKLRSIFRVTWNENVTLYTVRRASNVEIEQLEKDKTVLLKQQSRETVQLVIKE